MKLVYVLFYTCVLFCFQNFTYAAYLRLYCGTIEKFISVELNAPADLLKSDCFDSSLRSFFYTFGYASSPDTNASVLIVQTYLSLKKYNVFIIDWKEEASSPFDLDLIRYTVVAIPNAKKVGKICGLSLHIMSNNGLDLGTTHVVGYSLGAQMVGYCGRELQKFNKTISRITGLDPAGPVFDDLRMSQLPSSAEFVDVIHTDPGFFGTKRQLGHVDIWFNCHVKAQPNCADQYLLKFIDVALCNHEDAVIYYVAAVLNARAFPAVASRSCQHWQTSGVHIDSRVYVGETTNRRAHGNYYLTTNTKYPFGNGATGILARS